MASKLKPPFYTSHMENLILHKRGCEVLARFGNNPHGKPMYRLVRADSRRQWRSDVTREWPAIEFGPKYPKYGQCYVVEKWCPPEQYGTQSDWEDAQTLGPYPGKGDYELSLPLWDMNDQPITEPGEHQLQAIAWMIEKSAGLTRSQRWAQIQEAKIQADQERKRMLNDMVADARPLRGGDAERKFAEEAEELQKRMVVLPHQNIPRGASLSTGE